MTTAPVPVKDFIEDDISAQSFLRCHHGSRTIFVLHSRGLMRGTHVSQVIAQTFHLLGLISLERLKSRLAADQQSNTYTPLGHVR